MTKKATSQRPSRLKRLPRKSHNTDSGTDAAEVSSDIAARSVRRIRKISKRSTLQLETAEPDRSVKTRVSKITTGIPRRSSDSKIQTLSRPKPQQSTSDDCERQYQKFRPLNSADDATKTEIRTVGDEVMVLQVFSGIGMPSKDDLRTESLPPVDDSLVSRRITSTQSKAAEETGLEVASRFRSTKPPVVAPASAKPDASSAGQVVENTLPETLTKETSTVSTQCPELSGEDADLSEAGAFSLKDLQQQMEQFDAKLREKNEALESEVEDTEAYGDWFRRVILKHPAATWVTASYLYLLMILALIAVIIHSPETPASILVEAAFSDPEPLQTQEFEVSPQFEPMESTASAAEVQELNIETLSDFVTEAIAETTLPSHLLASAASTMATGTESEDTQPASSGIDRSPMTAAREGSFSVWTEPADPEPDEPYVIVIQIRLPEGVDQYSVSDLQGVVVGSDGYRKPIPGFMTGPLPVADGYSQLRIPIVSADENVRDTIYIKSRLLKETQKLTLSFQ